MDSEIFEKLPPTKLFFRCAIPSMITMAFGALYQIAEDLIESATYSGEFNDDFWNADMYNLDEYYYYDIYYGADEYFNASYNRVQLGTRMWVTISKDTYIKGLGIFKIPVTVSVTRSGLSERYWK